MQPLRWITVGYITGLLWGLYFKINIVPLIFLFLGGMYFSRKSQVFTKYKYIIVLFILAMFLSYTQIQHLENKLGQLYQNLDTINVVGIITSSGEETNYKKVYTLKVETINGSKAYQNTSLNLYCDKGTNLAYGKKISFIGTYQKAKGETNYKGFDYASYLKTKSIYGSVTLGKEYQISKKAYLNPILLFSHACKEKMEEKLEEILQEDAAIVKRNPISEILLV